MLYWKLHNRQIGIGNTPQNQTRKEAAKEAGLVILVIVTG